MLVTGAAGGVQGATGRRVAEALLAGGTPVRAFVRTRDARAAQLQDMGAELAVGDLREIADVEAAMVGVDRVFFTYPVLDGLLDATAVVRPRPGCRSDAAGGGVAVATGHQRGESAHPPALGVGTDLRRRRSRRGTPAGHGVLREPRGAGDGGQRDRGTRRAARAGDQRDPARRGGGRGPGGDSIAGRSVATGPVRLSPGGRGTTIAELAAEFSASQGIPLRYVDVDPQTWRERMLAAGWTPHTVEHLSRLWPVLSGAARSNPDVLRVTGAIEEVTGNPPETLRDFLRDLVRPTEAARAA